jgi:hypothetical protein
VWQRSVQLFWTPRKRNLAAHTPTDSRFPDSREDNRSIALWALSGGFFFGVAKTLTLGLVLRERAEGRDDCARRRENDNYTKTTITAQKEIAGRTQRKRMLVLTRALYPALWRRRCSSCVNLQTGELWWATCQASNSSAKLHTSLACPFSR